jgi:threonine dehydratase
VALTHEAIVAASKALAGVAITTPVLELDWIPQGGDLPALAKAEHLQRTGSFKFRGAYNAVAALGERREAGVITYSAGNHGQALAAAAMRFGIPATVVMPEDVVAPKLEGVRRYGATAVLAGLSVDARKDEAEALAKRAGYTIVPPFDDVQVVAGQATIGWEILEQVPDVEVILVPVGGGGLISGIAVAVHQRRPDVAVIGVEPVGKPAAERSLRHGSRHVLNDVDTCADGLRTAYIGELNWEIIRAEVDEVVLVDEESIIRAMSALACGAKQIVEPAGAVGVAALLAERSRRRFWGKRVVTVLSGGNVAHDLFVKTLTDSKAEPRLADVAAG